MGFRFSKIGSVALRGERCQTALSHVDLKVETVLHVLARLHVHIQIYIWKGVRLASGAAGAALLGISAEPHQNLPRTTCRTVRQVGRTSRTVPLVLINLKSCVFCIWKSCGSTGFTRLPRGSTPGSKVVLALLRGSQSLIARQPGGQKRNGRTQQPRTADRFCDPSAIQMPQRLFCFRLFTRDASSVNRDM